MITFIIRTTISALLLFPLKRQRRPGECTRHVGEVGFRYLYGSKSNMVSGSIISRAAPHPSGESQHHSCSWIRN